MPRSYNKKTGHVTWSEFNKLERVDGPPWVKDDAQRAKMTPVGYYKKVIAAKRGYTCAELAVGWVLRNPEVSVALVGAKNTEQVLLNARYMTDFTEAELAEIEEILDGTPDVGFQGETSEETRAAMAAQG